METKVDLLGVVEKVSGVIEIFIKPLVLFAAIKILLSKKL